MNRYLWDPNSSTFRDWNWRRNARTDRPSAAMLFPLFTGEADSAQADGVAAYVRARLLAPGGLLTTPVDTGQQWDAPNGCAPLQWAAVQGLNAYGHADLARTIAERWLATVSRVYAQTGKLLEKYDVQTEARRRRRRISAAGRVRLDQRRHPRPDAALPRGGEGAPGPDGVAAGLNAIHRHPRASGDPGVRAGVRPGSKKAWVPACAGLSGTNRVNLPRWGDQPHCGGLTAT